MATEEETREAATDGEEVQVEAVDLGTAHLQMNLDDKLSAHGMKDEAQIMDSTEGMLKVTEDQVLEKAPSVVEIPQEHTPNGTASSLNGHMKEGEIPNEKPQENGQKDNEQVEASPDGIRTDQSNKSNGEEAVDSLGHVESTTEDTSLLKDENEEPKEHYQQDVESAAVEDKMVHEDTVETDEPTVDAQQGQNLEPAEVTKDTQHASTSCIPHDEVIAEAPAGVQTCLEPNVDDSGALRDASDGNTETEPAKVDKESCPEDEDIAEHTNEIIKLEDQPSKQTDDVDAELVKADVPISKKTDVPEDVTKAEQADESASEETTPEHDATAREQALDVQEVQSQGLAEEIADAKEADSEKTVQQSGVSFEEATPEDNIATIEPSSDIQHLNNLETEEIKGLEDAVQDKEATEDIQPVQGLEEEPKSTGTVEVDEAANQPHANVLNNFAEEDGVPACQPQVTELEEEVKDTGVTETQEITQQSHAAASEELVTEENSIAVDSRNDDIEQTLEQGSVEVKDTEASETQEICHERTIFASEEDSAEDDVTAEGPISDAQAVENVESAEEIKDNTADNMVKASNVATVEEADEEHNVLTSEDVSEQQTREVEPEEIQSTEHVETEEASDERHPALLKDPAQEDSIPSDMLKTESTAEVKEIEATKTEALTQESNVSTSEEPASEENITVSERTCDAQEVENSEQAEDVDGNKDNGTKDITGQSNENSIGKLEEVATEDSTTILTDASIQQLQEQEPVEFKETEATEPQGISPSHIVSTSKESTPEDNVTAEPSPDSQTENFESATVTEETKDVENTDAVTEEETPEEHVQESEAPVHTSSVEEPELKETNNTDNQMDATVLENPTHEDTPTASEALVMESAEVSSSEAIEGQEIPQSEVTESEDHETEENTTASEPKVLEPEAAEEMRDSEATEPQSISQQSIVSSSDQSVPEEDVTEKEPASDTKEVQTEEPELIDEHNDEAGEISNQSSGTIVGETPQENLESSTVTEESRDVMSTDAIAEEAPEEHVYEFEAPVDIPPVDDPELEETKNTEPAEVHDNVEINDQPEKEVKSTEATEIAEIHNESVDLTDDVKRDVALADKAAPDEHSKATEATSVIPQAQDPELEETKNSEPVEVENNIIASDLPEEEIKDTEATETEVIPDESSTSAKITEVTKDGLAEEAAPEDLVETEATIDLPRAQEAELEYSKNVEPAAVEENISATDQSAEEIEATDATETEAINESINANTCELTEDVTAKEPASDIKEQTEEPELIDEHNDVKAGEISNQSSRTIVGETAQENLELATVTEETKDVKSTDAIAEETPAENVQEFEAPVDIPPVEEPEVEEAKNTEPVSVHDDAMTNDQPAEEVKDTQATEIAEIQNESGHLTEDVKSNVVLSDEAAPDEDAEATEETVDIPQAQDPEQEKIKNNEPVEVEDNIIARDLPEEEIKDTEAMDTEVIPDDSTSEKMTKLTNDVKSNVALAEEAAPEEHVIETEATFDIPRAQEPELEETKNTEPLEVDKNISATDQSAEEIKATEATETEVINDITDANSSELTEDVKRNFALEGEASHEEHVIAAETTVNIPPEQEPELEEIKNTESVEATENISVSDLPAEEVKETEVTCESTGANISEPPEDAKRNVALADEATSEDHVIAPEASVDISRAQDPVLEEIENAEHVEVEEKISENDLPAEENFTENEPQMTGIEPARPEPTPHESNVTIQQLQEQEPDKFRDTEATEPQGISPSHIAFTSEESAQEDNVATEPSPDTQAENLESAVVTEETKDVKSTDAIAEEETPEEHVQEFEAPVDIPPVEEPELEETKNTKPVEVHDNVATTDLQAEEVKNTEATEIAEIHNESGDLTEDVKSNVALADDAAPDKDAKATEETADIPRAQEPELEEIKNSEPVEVKENISASDLPAEEVKETEVISESTDANITENANRNAAVADEAAPEEHVIATEATVDIPRAQEPEIEEIENAEHVEVEENISANDLPAEEVKDTETMETQAIKDSTDANITEITEDVALADEAVPDVHVDIPPAQEPAVEDINNTKTVEAEDSITEDDVPAEEKNDIEAMETKEIPHESTDDSLTASAPPADTQQAQEESSEQRSDPDLLVQSEDREEQLVKAEETDQSNGATLEEPTAEDNAANETDPLADAKEEHGLESVEGNKGIEATEGEEASHPSQDAGLEELVSESIVATIERTSDIQQGTEAIDDEETSCKKTEVATLEDLSSTDNGTSPKQKDESSELGEKTAFTTQKGESPTDEDVVQISGEDTVGISNNLEQIKEQSKAVTEADTIESGEYTSDQGDEQLHNVELQMQVSERSVDVSTIEQPDKDATKVNLDLRQKEDEAIEEQTEEIQRNEQKHDDSSTDLTTETLLEPHSNEIGTTDLNQDTDEFEAEQTETVATQMLMNEQTLHVPQGFIPSTAGVKVEKSTEIEETPEQEKAPNNIGTVYTDADAENYNEDEKENIEIDAAAAKPSTDEQDGTADETTSEEIRNDLASPVENVFQKTSDPAPSNEETLENDTTVVPENVEPRVHREERECINKANDDTQASQASEEEIVNELEKKQERQNEDTDVYNDEVQTKPVDEEASEPHSNDSTDTKMDDTMGPYAEMVHGRIDAQPTEIEEVEDNKGFSSISEYVVENPEQNDVEQDLIIHPKVVDDKLATAEQNGAEAETNSNEEMATSHTAVTEAVKFDEVIDDKATGADGALSDENPETFEENRRNLVASSVVTASGESMNEDKEYHNLALPANSAVDGNTTEQASGSEVTERALLIPEKPLPTESEEHEESQTTKEQDEDIHGQETGDMEKEDKEDEQSDLPVSNFLMNLIMGKESTKRDGNLEFEAEKKQEETTKDDGCLITSQHEESLEPVPTENKVENKLIFEQGKHNLEGSEEIHDFKLESDEVLSGNTHNLEAPVCENNVQGEISSELVPGGPGLMTEVETRDIKLEEKATNSEEGSLKNNLDDSTKQKISQEDTLEEERTDLQHESLPEDISSDAVAGQTLLSTEPDTGDEKKLPNDNDDLQSPLSTKREESTESEAKNAVEAELENEVQREEEKQHTTNTGEATEGKIENLNGNSQKGTEAISDEQTAEITEPVMGTEINLVHGKEISTGSECEGETQSSKLSNSELHSSEKALDIQSAGSSLHINQDKRDELAGDQIVMEKNNVLEKPGESNLHEEQETEIGQESPKESDGGDQNCLAITEPVIKEENANKTVEAHVQTVNTEFSEEQERFMSQVQEHGLDVVSAKEAPEAEENIVEMTKPKFSTDEEQSSEEDKSNMAGEKTYVEKTKDQEEAKSFTDEVTTKIEEQEAVQKVSHNQTRDLNVVLPTEALGSEESFVDIKTPEFSTDEEQSPKEDESNTAEEKSYDEKTNGDEEAKNFTDEAPMKIEERGAGQKASPKKHNILSGVGSKVKHQLAKVKKAIIGKPGHTKSELPKS